MSRDAFRMGPGLPAVDYVDDDYRREQEAAAALQRAREAGNIATRARRQAVHAGGFVPLSEMARDINTQIVAPAITAATGAEGADVSGALAMLGREAAERVLPGGLAAAETVYGYSPQALAYSAVPFSDEALAGIDAALSDRTYGETQPIYAAQREAAEQANPVTAGVGYLSQGLATGPFMPMPPAAGNAGALRTGIRAIPRLAREGALFGGIAAADRSRSSVGAALSGIDENAPIMEQMSKVGSETSDLIADTARGGVQGAALNVALGVPLTIAGQAVRNYMRPGETQAMQGAFDDAVRNAPSVDETIADIELSVPQGREGVLAGIDMPAGSGAADVTAAMREAVPDMPAPQRLTLSSVMDELLTGNPDAERARAAGLIDRRQLRAAHNTMGLPGLSERMDRYGILRRGEIAPTAEVAERATRVRDIAGDALQAFRREMGGEFVDVDTVANRLDDLAEQYSARPHADYAPIAQQLRNDAAYIRQATQRGTISPTTQEAAYAAAQRTYADDLARLDSLVADRALADAQGNVARVAQLDQAIGEAQRRAAQSMRLPSATEPQRAPIGFIGWDELQSMINAQRERIRGIVTGSTVDNPGVRATANRQAYRAINQARDEAVEGAMGRDALGRYRLARDVFHTGALISPPEQLSTQTMRSPQLSRLAGTGTGASVGAAIGGQVAGAPGAAAGSVVGGALGFGIGNKLRDYQHAIIAAINDPMRGSLGEVAQDSARSILARVRGTATAPAMTEPIRMLLSMQPETVATGLRQLAASGDQEIAAAAQQGLTRMDVASRMPQIMQVLADRIISDPSVGGNLRPMLESAARRGTLQAVMYQLNRTDPQAAADLAGLVDPFALPGGVSIEQYAVEQDFAREPLQPLAPNEDDPFADPSGRSIEDVSDEEEFDQ